MKPLEQALKNVDLLGRGPMEYILEVEEVEGDHEFLLRQRCPGGRTIQEKRGVYTVTA